MSIAFNLFMYMYCIYTETSWNITTPCPIHIYDTINLYRWFKNLAKFESCICPGYTLWSATSTTNLTTPRAMFSRCQPVGPDSSSAWFEELDYFGFYPSLLEHLCAENARMLHNVVDDLGRLPYGIHKLIKQVVPVEVLPVVLNRQIKAWSSAISHNTLALDFDKEGIQGQVARTCSQKYRFTWFESCFDPLNFQSTTNGWCIASSWTWFQLISYMNSLWINPCRSKLGGARNHMPTGKKPVKETGTNVYTIFTKVMDAKCHGIAKICSKLRASRQSWHFAMEMSVLALFFLCKYYSSAVCANLILWFHVAALHLLHAMPWYA